MASLSFQPNRTIFDVLKGEQNTTSKFFELPYELRVMTYEFLFGAGQQIYVTGKHGSYEPGSSKTANFSRNRLAIMQVNKQVYSETNSMLFHCKTFNFRVQFRLAPYLSQHHALQRDLIYLELIVFSRIERAIPAQLNACPSLKRLCLCFPPRELVEEEEGARYLTSMLDTWIAPRWHSVEDFLLRVKRFTMLRIQPYYEVSWCDEDREVAVNWTEQKGEAFKAMLWGDIIEGL
ncbi:MAG: hypothetical protein M1820_003172 [Bogoriella megaspora]|nr:MAG: hypothetical protein M1820_003172 [Bogoriella megaspora]